MKVRGALIVTILSTFGGLLSACRSETGHEESALPSASSASNTVASGSSAAPSGTPPTIAAASAQTAGRRRSIDAPLILPAPVNLHRKAEPSALFARDEQGCDNGDKAACRSLADRYSGLGPRGGCGVPRARPAPFLRRAPSDAPSDEDNLVRAFSQACSLGDTEACVLGNFARKTSSLTDRDARWLGVRASPVAAGIRLFRSTEEKQQVWQRLQQDRDDCLTKDSCKPSLGALFSGDRSPKDGKLSAAIRQRAIDACAATHDCDDLYLALDRAGYSKQELSPVREAFAKILVDACEEGECTCGQATLYLPEDDPQLTDLGILGCAAGEAEGCYQLARAYEDGRGVAADAAMAKRLFEHACPTPYPKSNERAAEYSAHACDRLSALATDRQLALFYAGAACRFRALEQDHLPCVHYAMTLLARNTKLNRVEARAIAMGATKAGVKRPDRDECALRPSVEPACNDLRALLDER